jgi:tyrosine-protein kinase Etk/Wzc
MSTQNKIPIINQKFDLITIIRVIKRSIWIIIAFFIVAYIIGFFYLRYTPPKYSSTSIIQVQTKNKTNEILGIRDINETGIESIIELLRSQEFLKRCFSLLPLEISYYKEGTFLANELYRTSPFEVEYQFTHGDLVGTKFDVDFDKLNKIIISYKLGGQNNEYEIEHGEWTEINGASIRINRVDHNQIQAYQNQLKKNGYSFIINSPKTIINQYANKLQIRILNKNAGTIEISFTDKNQKKSTDIVNIISTEFIKYDVEKKHESSSNIINYINQQLGLVFTQLDSTEKQLHSYRHNNKFDGDISSASLPLARSSVSMPMPLFTTKLSEFENEVINLDFEIQTLESIAGELSKRNVNMYELMAMLTGTRSESFMKNMLNSMLNLYNERAILLNDVTEDNHKIKTIDKQIESKKEQIIHFIQTTIDRLQQSQKDYIAKIQEYEKLLYSDTAHQEIEYSRLKRLYSINESFYHQLIQKKAEHMISQAGYVSNNTILEQASIPKKPVSPDKKSVIGFTSLIALFVSVIFVLIRYMFYNKISTIQEIMSFTNIPVIGAIPLHNKKSDHSQLVVHINPKSMLTESFRNIRSNMEFMTETDKPRIIAISSTVSGEGKTFVAINLAGILAMTNKKVVLLDLDLRKPRIHKSFEIENLKGLSTILIKKHRIEECVQPTEIDNLSIIPSGPVPPNPSELVLTQNYLDLLSYLKERYDFIVIDTPPVGVVTDAIRSYQSADYGLYIMRASHSPRTFLAYINNFVQSRDIQNMSLILNGVDESASKYGYGYGYNYSYSYGYRYTYGYANYIKQNDYYDEPPREKKSVINKLFKKPNK